MKKVLNVLLVGVFSLSLIGCSNKPKPKDAVETFLNGFKSGNIEKCDSVLNTDLREEFDSVYSYFNSFSSYYDLSNIDDDTLAAINELDEYSLKLSCRDYTIDEISEVSETEYDITVTISAIDYTSVDTSEIEDELYEKYNISEEDIDGLDENAQMSLFIKNLAGLYTEMFKYVLENGELETYEAVFKVIDVDGSWLIDAIN